MKKRPRPKGKSVLEPLDRYDPFRPRALVKVERRKEPVEAHAASAKGADDGVKKWRGGKEQKAEDECKGREPVK